VAVLQPPPCGAARPQAEHGGGYECTSSWKQTAEDTRAQSSNSDRVSRPKAAVGAQMDLLADTSARPHRHPPTGEHRQMDETRQQGVWLLAHDQGSQPSVADLEGAHARGPKCTACYARAALVCMEHVPRQAACRRVCPCVRETMCAHVHISRNMWVCTRDVNIKFFEFFHGEQKNG